jgi:hypothetical protein
LVAIVVPEDFPIQTTVAAPERLEQRTKGWLPVPTANYMMNLAEQVSGVIAESRSAGKDTSLQRWGWGQLEYNVVRR